MHVTNSYLSCIVCVFYFFICTCVDAIWVELRKVVVTVDYPLTGRLGTNVTGCLLVVRWGHFSPEAVVTCFGSSPQLERSDADVERTTILSPVRFTSVPDLSKHMHAKAYDKPLM